MQNKVLILSISFAIMFVAGYSQTNTKVAVGDHASFTSKYTGAYTYQWQEDQNKGYGFKNITDTNRYTGPRSANLQIPKVTVSMSGYKYHCIVTDTSGTPVHVIQDPNSDTLTVTTGISKIGDYIIENDNVTISSTAPIGNYQWQENNGFGFENISGATSQKYALDNVGCSKNRYAYRCVVTDSDPSIHTEIISDTDTLIVTGCITQIPGNTSVGNKTSFVISHKNIPGLTYQWKVKPLHSGSEFVAITGNDSDTYHGYATDTLTILNASPALNGSEYIGYVTAVAGQDSSEPILNLTGKIARVDNQNRFSLSGAYYSSIQGINDDNSASLTQFYLRANVYRKTEGTDINSNACRRWSWFRNFFLQVTYSTNANNISYFNTHANSFTVQDTSNYRGVNKLDLLENATLNINFMTPLLTYFIPSYKYNKKPRLYGDIAHFYLDPFAALLISHVSDYKDTTNTLEIFSLQYGINATVRSEDLMLNKLPLYIEISAKMFWIDVLSNTINPNLNYQQTTVSGYIPQISRDLTTNSNQPYYNLDGLLMYNTSQTSNSNVFLHFSFFTNLITGSKSLVYNNYWQLQGGYSLDFNALFAKLNKKS